MFNLSGAINVLLFLVIRPQLLLFPRPKALVESDTEQDMELEELAPQGTSSAVFTDVAQFQHSPEPTPAALLTDEGFRESSAQARFSSDRISV